MDPRDLEAIYRMSPAMARMYRRAEEKAKLWAEYLEKLWPLIAWINEEWSKEDEALANWENEGGAMAPRGGVW